MREKWQAFKAVVKRHPYIALTLFVALVALAAGLGYLRYQQVQAELAAQQNWLHRAQASAEAWADDFSMRFENLKRDALGTAAGVTNVAGGAWGILSYFVSAFLDYIGNLHIMLPVTVVYLGIIVFGLLKMKIAALLGALIAFFLSTRMGIVPGSVIGLLVMAALLLWDKLDARLLTRLQELPARLQSRLRRARRAEDAAAGAPEQAA